MTTRVEIASIWRKHKIASLSITRGVERLIESTRPQQSSLRKESRKWKWGEKSLAQAPKHCQRSNFRVINCHNIAGAYEHQWSQPAPKDSIEHRMKRNSIIRSSEKSKILQKKQHKKLTNHEIKFIDKKMKEWNLDMMFEQKAEKLKKNFFYQWISGLIYI